MFFVLSGLAAADRPLLFSPYAIKLDVPAGFWFRAPCPEPRAPGPDLLGACSVPWGVCPASPPACPELRGACCKSCVGSPVAGATVAELCASGDNPCAACPACTEFRG